jgi:hypothetical protein
MENNSPDDSESNRRSGAIIDRSVNTYLYLSEKRSKSKMQSNSENDQRAHDDQSNRQLAVDRNQAIIDQQEFAKEEEEKQPPHNQQAPAQQQDDPPILERDAVRNFDANMDLVASKVAEGLQAYILKFKTQAKIVADIPLYKNESMLVAIRKEYCKLFRRKISCYRKNFIPMKERVKRPTKIGDFEWETMQAKMYAEHFCSYLDGEPVEQGIRFKLIVSILKRSLCFVLCVPPHVTNDHRSTNIVKMQFFADYEVFTNCPAFKKISADYKKQGELMQNFLNYIPSEPQSPEEQIQAAPEGQLESSPYHSDFDEGENYANMALDEMLYKSKYRMDMFLELAQHYQSKAIIEA